MCRVRVNSPRRTSDRNADARNRYIESVAGYNTLIRSFPNNLTAMMFGYETKPNFSVQNEAQISTAPKVEFATPPPVAPTN